jgi:hypothetical protein
VVVEAFLETGGGECSGEEACGDGSDEVLFHGGGREQG